MRLTRFFEWGSIEPKAFSFKWIGWQRNALSLFLAVNSFPIRLRSRKPERAERGHDADGITFPGKTVGQR